MPPSGLHAGHYELLTRLAAGGMGEVFIARRSGAGAFEKRVALKLLLPHLSRDPEFVNMFLDEARIAARMDHPNIVPIFDLGEAEGRYFIAMSLVEGVSFARLLWAANQAGEQLPLPLVRLVGSGLSSGLAYAHGLEVIHRDVNPANVLVSTAGAVLLTDFGIAKAKDNLHQTRPGNLRGKHAYMAPEQVTAQARVGARADLFGAAVTLFEAATGVSPFARKTEAETLDALCAPRRPEPRDFRPDLSDGLAGAIRQCLEVSPSQRLATATQLLDAMADGPVAAPRELGAWVSRLCAPDLAAFRGAADDAPRSVGTRSLLGEVPMSATVVPAPAAGTPRSSVGALAVAFVAGVLALSGALGVVWWLRPSARAAARSALPPVEAREAVLPPTPAPPAAPVSGPKVTPPPHRAPAHAARSPIPPADKDTALHIGFLSADARPWADIYVEGHAVDRTPVSRYPLTAGEHVLVFKNPSLGREQTRRVVIEEGKVATLQVDFQQ